MCAAELPSMGDKLPPKTRLFIRQAVTLITLVQTLAGLGPLSDRTRVLALVLVAMLGAGWAVVTTRRSGDGRDVIALIVVIGAGAWLHVLTGNGQVFVASYAALFI